MYFLNTIQTMKTTPNETIRELRRILGQTQGEFAAMIGASKDTVVSWETGRNRLSAAFARRIGFATGVDEDSLAGGEGVPRLTLPVAGARGYTAEDFARYRGTTKGRSDQAGARRHLRNCVDTLALIFLAAAESGGEGSRHRVPGVLHSFIEWSEGVRRDFELGPRIDEQLERRRAKAGVTLSYGEWRRMAREEAARLRAIGFKDDARERDEEMLRLEVEVRPGWAPGRRMRLPNAAVVEVMTPPGKGRGVKG
jgi:transcriptional regulator with XRE-family HTH domain